MLLKESQDGEEVSPFLQLAGARMPMCEPKWGGMECSVQSQESSPGALCALLWGRKSQGLECQVEGAGRIAFYSKSGEVICIFSSAFRRVA